jgi:hypothetical protein
MKPVMVVIIFMLAAGDILAQETPAQPIKPAGPSRYYIGNENELLIPVNILGYVRNPGQYMVPTETDLIAVVAFAGGFREDAKLGRVQILRSGAMDHGQPTILKVDLIKYFNTGNPKLIPRLMPDDTILIGGSGAATFKNVLDFIARISILFQIYFYVQASK